MNIGNNLNLSNGLQLCVDWLSWTFRDPCDPMDVIKFLGYSAENFRKHPSGRNGYRSQLVHCAHNISIQYEGNENMGVHVDVSGSAVADMLKHFHDGRMVETVFQSQGYETADFQGSVLRDLLSDIVKRGQVTRLDLAVDDIGCNFYTMSELHDILETHSYTGRFRSWQEVVSNSSSDITGRTLYLGKRSSSIMLRIYDKQLEQNAKNLAHEQAPIETPWIRWELELKKERAQLASELLSQGLSLSLLIMGVLGNHFCIREKDNARNTRCSTAEKWQHFLENVQKLSLYCPKTEKTLDDTKQWLYRQVAPSLASIVLADGGSMDFLMYLLQCGAYRLNNHQSELVRKAMEIAV